MQEIAVRIMQPAFAQEGKNDPRLEWHNSRRYGAMFQKILIANRGEIACRVLRTARRMGIATVAVYSQADKDALHVGLADEAICIGPAPAAQSYLAIDSVVKACRETGAEAVHPGYGFLSENGAFAERLEREAITFIGPPRAAIASMGDKIASKRLAKESGVNTIPGYDDVIHNADHAVMLARDIGYPVMLKASAGGGGKGMRVVRGDDECREGFEGATREAKSSFGDERVFLERYIDRPRHIEIQVLGDRYGNVIHLGERECSLQRRHQKVIEEAPSPFLDSETRDAMGRQAVALARAVGYQSAGTVEFIVDAYRQFYFLEMNTRLQVEHPVTECLTGLDLVELMFRIAAGEPLPLSQSEVQFKGWAMEARIYAEDPFRNFLPSVGRLVRYAPPEQSESIRVDTGVYEGGEISLYYDPMIAKLIASGATRDEARARLRDALNEFCIRGVTHNISFLGALVEHPRFKRGDLSTHFIAEEFPNGFSAADVVHDEPEILVVVAAAIHRRYRERAARISGQLPGYEPKVDSDWVVLMDGVHHRVNVQPIDGGHVVHYAGENYRVLSAWQFGLPVFHGQINERPISIQVERRNLDYRLFHWGCEVDVTVLSARAAELLALMPVKKPQDTSKFVLAPMPGLLVLINVAPGDEVKTGQDVAVMEAMKMENTLRAERDGKVLSVFPMVGDTLDVDQPIVEFE